MLIEAFIESYYSNWLKPNSATHMRRNDCLLLNIPLFAMYYNLMICYISMQFNWKCIC